jgi:NAD(P)H-flavin reductase
MPNPVKIPASVESVVSHGEGVYTVSLRPEGRAPRFKAGQFLHLTVDEFDPAGGFWPESRVFSIASQPGGELVSIVYSVKGVYTRKMEKALVPGAGVWLKLPYGDFVINANIKEGQDVVLVAGGTGVSPFIPYLESLCQDGSPHGKVALYYGARLRSYILFPDLIERCAKKISDFSAIVSIESESSSGLKIDGARLRDGRLSIDAIYAETKGMNDPVYFLSGPPVMIRLFMRELAEKGVARDNIKIDEWE